jgi:DNA-binding response OmpR family regulator/KaiC/GvpD/RAD55 family RecA-like ATPase
MSVEGPKLIPSGIEPVDKLLGGLEPRQLYLAYGDRSAQSLLGILFLIEGLKRKENVALITHHTPEDAMSQFARLGYDCLEDVQQGKLVILEYSERVIEQVSRLSRLTPILQELEWWFKETPPRRFVFDSLSSLIAPANHHLQSRAREFAEWAASFAATVLLVDSDKHSPVIKEFIPLIKEAFRLEFNQPQAKTRGSLIFEKSPNIPGQAVELDASRGLFLLNDSSHVEPNQNAGLTDKPSDALPGGQPVSENKPRLRNESVRQPQAIRPGNMLSESPSVKMNGTDHISKSPADTAATRTTPPFPVEQANAAATNFVDVEIGSIDSSPADQALNPTSQPAIERQTAELPKPVPVQGKSDEAYDFSDFVAELDVEIGELDLSKAESAGPFVVASHHKDFVAVDLPNKASINASPLNWAPENQDVRPADERAVYLRRATDLAARTEEPSVAPPSTSAQAEKAGNAGKAPAAKRDGRNFNVAVIDYDAASCGRIAKALDEFNVEIYKEGLNAVAGIIASPPDLVVLDVDTPIVDGFKLLAHIRATLPVPIIALSKFHLRASDRILSTELGADYYLTKPFSLKELHRKSRQLIARYRGINSWIATPAAIAEALSTQADEIPQAWLDREQEPGLGADFNHNLPKFKKEKLEPYSHFIHHVEERVKTAMAEGTVFSMVGFRLEPNTEAVTAKIAQLFDLVSESVRADDLISTNTRNDLVILLPDTDTKGASGFVKRLRKQVTEELNQSLTVWIRNFPNLEEAYQVIGPGDAELVDAEENQASNSAKA